MGLVNDPIIEDILEDPTKGLFFRILLSPQFTGRAWARDAHVDSKLMQITVLLSEM